MPRSQDRRAGTQLKRPIQLSSFLFAGLAVALIRHVDPTNVASMGIAGVIGELMVTIPLAFDPGLIRELDEKQYAWLCWPSWRSCLAP